MSESSPPTPSPRRLGAGISPSILDAIGWTPLVALDRLGAGLPGRVVLKIEGANPGASIKDRAALHCIEEAERDGRLSRAAWLSN